MASLGSSLKAMVSLMRVLTKICVCDPCRRRLFGSPEDVVVLETHVLCAYSVSLLSDLYSPFPFFASHGSSPAPSFSLSLFCVRACAPLRLRPSSTHSFACVDVARLVPNQLFLCRLCGRTGCGCGSIVFSCGSGWRGGRCCVSFFPALSLPPFSSSLHLPCLPFLSCFSYSPSVSYALTPWHFPYHHLWPQWLGRLVDSERRQQPPSLLALVAVCGEPPPAGASPRA